VNRTPASRAAIAVALAVAAAGGLAVAADDPDTHLRALARDAGQGQALMRIGLEARHAVEISSKRPFRVVDLVTGRDAWRPLHEGVLRAVADGGPELSTTGLFRVQVGAYANREAAERERGRLERELGVPAVVREDPDRGNWRVRVGAETDRLALLPLIERLREANVANPWIAEEPSEEIEGVRLRLVDASYESHLTERTRLAVVPTSGDRLRVDGTTYRGVVELRINEFGLIRPINWIDLESYLRGVVPAELGPEVWPQVEALKAQAVAARTYAWRNRDQFAAEGFDLCATPRCQAYGGADAEHPLSDRAVSDTKWEILTWQGEPIIAYYTATCGGHTEDGHEVFPEEQDRPYLRGVPCRAEGDALAAQRFTLAGRAIDAVIDETGRDVTREVALLEAAGVLDPQALPSDWADRPADPVELRGWTSRLAALSGLPPPAGPEGETGTLGQAAATILADLGWAERSRVLLSGADVPALLRDPEAADLPEDERRALAYLAFTEAIVPFPDGRYHVARTPSAASLVPVLSRIGDSYEAFGLAQGVVSAAREQSLRLIRGKGEVRRELAARPFLFSLGGGKPVPAERLEIWPGDRVSYRSDKNGRIDFLEVDPPVKGASDDRVAAVYSWEERKTRNELEASINRRVAIGRLIDLEVVRRGVSGRVVELRVVGSRASTTVRGFDVRRLLDLRESLIVMEIQRGADGEVEAVVFAGKGWGHGVGLCQVGAYGMAVRGASYREILAHFYTGAKLERIRDRRS